MSHFRVFFGKTTELVHSAITGPCLRMRHRPSACWLYQLGRFTCFCDYDMIISYIISYMIIIWLW